MSTSAPRYREIADELRRRIECGDLPPGARVPSTRGIVDEWGVAMATATRVLTELRQQGLVRAMPGVGTVVAETGRAPRPAPAQRRQRAPEGELTSERIVSAGIAVADAEGIGAVSMRRVAHELGVATMSLYRHVADKDALLLHMMDTVFGDARLPEVPANGWRPRVEALLRTFWGAFRAHPWLASVLSITRPQLVSQGMAITEQLLAALEEPGLDHATTFTAYITLINYVRGTALNLEMEAEAEAVTGLDQEQWVGALKPQWRTAVEPEFPVLARYVSQAYDFDLDQLFEFGLHLLLDGLAQSTDAAHQ